MRRSSITAHFAKILPSAYMVPVSSAGRWHFDKIMHEQPQVSFHASLLVLGQGANDLHQHGFSNV